MKWQSITNDEQNFWASSYTNQWKGLIGMILCSCMLKSIDYVGLINEIEPKRTQAGYAGYTQGPHLYIEY